MPRLDDYMGYAIELDEKTGIFSVHEIETAPFDINKTLIGMELANADTLTALKEKIKVLSKQKFGQLVLIRTGRYMDTRLVEGKISSIKVPNSIYGSMKFRVSFKDPDDGAQRRLEELNASDIWKLTNDNKEKYQKAVQLRKQAEDLNRQAQKFEDSMERYTKEELLRGE